MGLVLFECLESEPEIDGVASCGVEVIGFGSSWPWRADVGFRGVGKNCYTVCTHFEAEELAGSMT